MAATPLLLSPLVLFALAEVWVDLGGGEKDVILVVPYFIGTLTFFVCAVILIARKWPLAQWARLSVVISMALLLTLALVTYLASWLGIA